MSLVLAPSTLMLTLLGAASLILYFAGRVVMGAIPARADGATARAALGAMPVFVVSLVAVAMDRPQIALHLPLACATAALTFGLGTVLVGRPVDGNGSRSWAMLLPAIAMALIATLGGPLTLGASALLVIFGTCALLAWRVDATPAAAKSDTRASRVAVITWSIATVACAVAGTMAMTGLPALERIRQMPSDALATAFLLSPAIVVPIVFELLPPCRPIGWSASISSLAKFALICITFALPLAAVAVAVRPTFAAYAATTQVNRVVASTMPTTIPMLFPSTRLATTTPTDAAPAATAAALAANVLKFPSLPGVPQRADLLVLAGVALLLLPLSAGTFRLGRLESVALIACYVFDLAMTMMMVMR